MKDIYCHIHTPINIEDENKSFLQPVIYDGTLYILKEKKLQDALFRIGYLKDYIMFTRQYGYESICKWLYKKNLLNCGFLEGVSKYWIDDIHLKYVSDYMYFQKNDENKPVISDKYLKSIYQKAFLYTHIREYKDIFNEDIAKRLDLIENELSSIKEEKSQMARRLFYQNRIFEMIMDNFTVKLLPYINQKLDEINNIRFSCESLLSQNDLFVYKTSSINGYKNLNFKLTNVSHKECLKENTFIKLYANLDTRYYGEDYLMYILEQLRECSSVFASDTVDFGVDHLKKIIGTETINHKKKNESVKYLNNEYDSSSVTLLQKTQTIISQTEDHIISRYNSLKNHTNIYLAPEKEIITLLSVLNMNSENLKRMNSLIWESLNKIETELVKFTFKKGNLPYSSYGFASINF